MSISALSSDLVADLSQTQQNPFQQVRQDFKQLASALQSGNLSDAQSAYASIQNVLQQSQANTSTASGSGSSTLSDFAALGQALQSGNLTQAQSSFSQLRSDVQTSGQTGTAASGAGPVAQDQYVPSNSQTQDPAQQVQQDYAQLAGALQSGNLTNAQSAYSSLEQVLQTQAGSNTTSDTNSATNSSTSADPIANDLTALGQALTSGNLNQAQGAFSQLQSDVQTAQQTAGSQSQSQAPVEGHHHHHHHGGGSSSASSTSTTASTNSSTVSATGSNVDIYG